MERLPHDMERLPGWEARLAAALEEARARPYRLGEHDCFRLACAALEALTGVNRWPEFAGRYADRRGALALIARHGRSFDEAFTWFFGVPPGPAAAARRGDIARFDWGGEAHLAVVCGAEAAVLAPEGLLFVPRSRLAHAWRVG